MTCPKCGEGEMSRPRYWQDAYCQEWLVRTCSTCSYTTSEPTKDAIKKTEARR